MTVLIDINRSRSIYIWNLCDLLLE